MMKDKLSPIIYTLLLLYTTLFSTSYYVDYDNGNDVNSGTSPESAWKTLDKISNNRIFQPGDSILFRSGSVWNSHLDLRKAGSGEHGKPLVIDKYGEGPKPLINGCGYYYTIFMKNQEYWEINNLEIVNTEMDYQVADKKGIWIMQEDFGEVNHIRLNGLDVHDIEGSIEHKYSGGIFFDIQGDDTPTYFNGILVENCYIHDLTRAGMQLQSTWNERTPTENINWVPSLNTIVRNNTFARIEANGLCWRVSFKPLVENNVYISMGEVEPSNAMFFFNCDSALAQYNESYKTAWIPGETDGAGFDCDYRCKYTIYQYNYSHDNGNAFMTVCCQGGVTRFNENNIIRYNISQNDHNNIFRVSGINYNTFFYNNTVFIGPERSPRIIYHKSWNGWSTNTYYHNNLIYNMSENSKYEFGESVNSVVDNNLFYGYHPESEPHDPNKITDNPMLVAPGTGKIGLNTVDGYKLLAGSPCIDAGKKISGSCDYDYWGNEITDGKPDIGAFELTEVASSVPEKPTELTSRSVAPDVIKLDWKDNSDNEAGFVVSRKTAIDSFPIFVLIPENQTTFIDSGLFSSTNYEYQLHSYNSAGKSDPLISQVTTMAGYLEDSYIQGGLHSNENFGSSPELIVKASKIEDFTRIAYIRFNLNGMDIGGPTVKLSLYCNELENDVNIAVYGTIDEWSQNFIAWDNAPEIGDSITAIQIKNDQYNDWDLSEYVGSQLDAGDSLISLALFDPDTSSDKVVFASSETIDKEPKLVFNEVGTLSEQIGVPSDYKIYQNYPNPFNPNTNIKYQLPEEAKVRIDIFNICGEKVKTLQDGDQNSGIHIVKWNGLDKYGNKAPGGVYFYRLVAKKKSKIYQENKKMFFIK